MALSSWLCKSNTKSMLVKIVHPDGRIELHDRPMLAAEIMIRNPRCCVTHPHVFREPSAIVAPDAVLMLGQKYYVVPVTTLRKLQRVHSKRSPSPLRHVHSSRTPKHKSSSPKVEETEDGTDFKHWFFANKGDTKLQYCCLKQDEDDDGKQWSSGSLDTSRASKESERGGSLSENSCLQCLFGGMKSRVEEGPTQYSMDESSESNVLHRRTDGRNEEMGLEGSPKRPMKDVSTSSDQWQPSLERINEEQPY